MTLSLHLNANRVIRVRLKSILKDGKSPTSSSSATSWCASCATCATSWRACCTTSAPSTRPASRQCQVDLATFSTAALLNRKCALKRNILSHKVSKRVIDRMNTVYVYFQFNTKTTLEFLSINILFYCI